MTHFSLQDNALTSYRKPCKATFPVLCCDVAAGDSHVAASCWAGALYLWGENHHGQCARDPKRSSGQLVRAPARAELQGCLRVACGRYHSAALSDGRVFTFGDGLSGQLGRREGAQWRPTEVACFPNDLQSSVLVQARLGWSL